MPMLFSIEISGIHLVYETKAYDVWCLLSAPDIQETEKNEYVTSFCANSDGVAAGSVY